MKDKDVKWFFIALAVAAAAPMVGLAVSDYSKNNAKRDIIVACYQTGNKDCDTLWNKEIK